MKHIFIGALLICFQISYMGCKKNSATESTTSIDPNKITSVEVYLINLEDSLTFTYTNGDSMFMPISSKNTYLSVLTKNDLGKEIPLKDSVYWSIALRQVTVTKRVLPGGYVRSDEFMVNTDSLLVGEENSNTIVTVSCFVSGIRSRNYFINVVYNATRFNYKSIVYSDGKIIDNIKLSQSGKLLYIRNSENQIIKMLNLKDYRFEEQDIQTGSDLFTSDLILTYNTPLAGTYKSKLTNDTGSWQLK